MVRMFCTLKEATHKLETSEAELEALLEQGALREFRDGSNRFLKMADLEAFTAGQSAGAVSPPSAAHSADTEPTSDTWATAAYGTEIKLPPMAAVISKTRRPPSRTPNAEPAAAPRVASQGRALPPEPRSVPRVNRHPSPPRAQPHAQELSFRQWAWKGLLDDRPYVIIVLLLVVLAGVCSLAGAAYLIRRLF